MIGGSTLMTLALLPLRHCSSHQELWGCDSLNAVARRLKLLSSSSAECLLSSAKSVCGRVNDGTISRGHKWPAPLAAGRIKLVWKHVLMVPCSLCALFITVSVFSICLGKTFSTPPPPVSQVNQNSSSVCIQFSVASLCWSCSAVLHCKGHFSFLNAYSGEQQFQQNSVKVAACKRQGGDIEVDFLGFVLLSVCLLKTTTPQCE